MNTDSDIVYPPKDCVLVPSNHVQFPTLSVLKLKLLFTFFSQCILFPLNFFVNRVQLAQVAPFTSKNNNDTN